MYKIIDTNNWYRKDQYNWFKTFSNPCYGLDLRLDVTDIVKYSKETNTKFFINFIYVLTMTFNSFDCMKLRIVNNEVRLYDTINPTYCVLRNKGGFSNGKIKNTLDYKEFYKLVYDDIESIKNDNGSTDRFNDSDLYDDYYYTCLPWLDYNTMIHPIPDNNASSCSCPRVCFGKYILKDEKYTMAFNLYVSHVLVDGYDLSMTINKLQENLYKVKEFLK